MATSRQEIWAEKLALAGKASAFLRAHVPSVRAVALTGSVAYGDVSEDDDLDFLIITAPGRVYTTRLACYLWAILLGKKRRAGQEKDSWCLNLFLDEADLVIPLPKRTDFARLQIQRLRVLADPEHLCEQLKQVNREWLEVETARPGGAAGGTPAATNQTLAGPAARRADHSRLVARLGDGLEALLRTAQLAYMRPRVTREYLSRTQIFFHPRERGPVRTGPRATATAGDIISTAEKPGNVV